MKQEPKHFPSSRRGEKEESYAHAQDAKYITTFVVMSRQVRLWYYAHATIPTDDAHSLLLQHIRGYTAVTTVALFVQTSSTPSTVLTYVYASRQQT